MANTASTWQYVVVTGPLRGLRDAFCHVKSAQSTVMSPTWRVTRIPSLVLHNTWHYVIIRYSYGEIPKFVLRCSYEAALHKGVTTALHLISLFDLNRHFLMQKAPKKYLLSSLLFMMSKSAAQRLAFKQWSPSPLHMLFSWMPNSGSNGQTNMAWGSFKISNGPLARRTRPIRIQQNSIQKGDGGQQWSARLIAVDSLISSVRL